MRQGEAAPAGLGAVLGLVVILGSSLSPAAPPDAGTDGELAVRCEGDEVLIGPAAGRPGWHLGIATAGPGARGDAGAAYASCAPAGKTRIERAQDPLLEWYESSAAGIEHGLEIREAGDSASRIDFVLSGPFTPKVSEDGQRILFRDAAGAPVLEWIDFAARDAGGREVDVVWERVENGAGGDAALRLIVQGADHAFPLRVIGRIVGVKSRVGGASAAPLASSPVVQSAPANDTCAGAQTIPGDGPFPLLTSTVDLTEATGNGDPPPPSCQGDVSRGVWFSFTPATSAMYDFSACADAPTATTIDDTVLVLYAASGACAGLVEMAGGCSDDACGPAGLQSSIRQVPLAAGSTYYLMAFVYGPIAPPAGSGDLQVYVERHDAAAPPPANDLCAGAEAIPPDGPFPWLTSIVSDLGGATTAGDPPLPACQANVSRSVWYTFTPAASGRFAFSLCADAPTATTVDDTVLAIYSATADCSGLVEVAGGCDDDSCAGEAAQSVIAGVPLVAGTRYYAVVWGYGPTPPPPGNGAVQMRVTRTVTPANDTCSGATTLALDAPVPGTTVSAFDDTRLPAGSACFTGPGQMPSVAAGGDVAYRFTSPGAGLYSFRAGGFDPARNLVLYVAGDCPGGAMPATVGACLGAANRSASSPEESACLPLTAGQVVFVYVDEDTPGPGSDFVIEANRCAPEKEPNGTPAQAEEVACGVEGSITPAGDADYFVLGAPAAGSRVFALVDGAAGNSTDFDLRVTTAADTLEYDDVNNDVPFGSAAPNVAGTRLDGTASYLRVSHYSAAAQAEPYRLYACVQPPAADATPETEPNDTPAAATGAAGGYYAGALSSAGDVDLFAFTATAGELVQIGLDLDPLRDNTPWNGSLALLDATGTTLLLVNDPSIASSTSSGGGSLSKSVPYAPAEAIAWRVRATGTYYVKVGWSSGTPGDYLLSVCRGCRPGTLPDADGDGAPDADDCAPADPAAWSVPGEAIGLLFAPGTGQSHLQWSAPVSPGGSQVRYDLLRSASAAEFQSPNCLAVNTLATSGDDPALPASTFFYLVRSRNVCGWNAGAGSSGVPRVVGTCP
jgi:hypothetical protein